nr:NmrA/HSCARG family protein [Pseudonocardia acidicola]
MGATGGQGGAVLNAVLADGMSARAVVRDPGSASARRIGGRGVQVVAGAFDDREALAAAMHGVAGVFALTTPFESGPDAEVAQGRAILAAAREARVGHLVFASVAAADQGTGVPHFESEAIIERELAAGAIPYTIIAPTYFFDNALAGGQQIRAGVLPLPLPPHRRLQQLARPDLGRVAAQVLAAPAEFTGRRIELAGDEPTATEMAAALTAALGREVRHEEVPISAIGNPDMRAMWEFLRGPGFQVDLAALRSELPGIGWTSFATWARQVFHDEPRP